MSDLKERLRVLDQAAAPDVWEDATTRSMAATPPRHRNSGRIITIAVSLALFAAAAIFAWRTFDQTGPVALGESTSPSVTTSPSTIEVPDVVGLSVAGAKSALEAKGFSVEIQRETDANPVGTVSRQSPAAGDAAPIGSIVKIVVSEGLPGNDLGNLDCPSEQQSAQIIYPSIKLVPLSATETVPDLIRRTFSGVQAGDQVTTSTSEGGTFVVISRSGATIARAFLTPHLQDWMLAEVSSCAGSGVNPPT